MPPTPAPTTRPAAARTLADRLSHLTHAQACRLLGAHARALLREGGALEIELGEQVRLAPDRFELRLADAVVTITLDSGAQLALQVRCSACRAPCVHAGAALALVLEEKSALGLAAPPEERVAPDGPAALREAALAERRERARSERMAVRSSDPKQPWTDYVVTSAASGRSYRVALRALGPGESYCSCPDFRKNTLGTCKHLLRVEAWARKRFPARRLRAPHRRTRLAVYVHYGEERELRLAFPSRPLPAPAARLVAPLRAGAIADVGDLLRRLRRLAALGEEVAVHPDAEAWIQERLHRERIAALVEAIRKDPAGHPLRTTLLRVELLPYQLDGIAFAVGAGRAILADEVGLGKTPQAIGVAELLRREAGIERVLVVCPATLKAQWRREIERFSGHECQLVVGGARERNAQYRGSAFFTVCNYEQLLRDVAVIGALEWDLVILDEAQRIKNWEAKTSRLVKRLRSRFALALSATPLENRLDELYSVVEFVDERRLGPAFRFFARHRTRDAKGKVLGYEDLSALRAALAPVLLRRTRDSVLQELPERTTEIVRIEPTPAQASLHAAHMRTVAAVVRKRFLTEMDLLRLRQALLMCRMAADASVLVDKVAPGESSKLERLFELLDELLREERKIVLFSEWTSMLDLVEHGLRRRRARWVRLDGSVPQRKRQALVDAFRDDPACRLFLTTNAGSTGLNLQAADTVVNVDLPWNPALLEQRIGRVHRMGQRRPVQVFLLVTEETIEESLLATLAAKHELAQAVLDPDSEVEAVDLVSSVEELRQRLEVLLGARPALAPDAGEAAARVREAEAAAQRERVAEAGGALVGAAFGFLAELLPSGEPSDEAKRLTGALRERLAACLAPDGAGRPTLTVTLPDTRALDALASTLGRLLAEPQGPRPPGR